MMKMPLEGFYRLYTGIVSEGEFCGKVNVGPVGDIIFGFEPAELVPFASKIIDWGFLRHSGGNDRLAQPVYDIKPTREIR